VLGKNTRQTTVAQMSEHVGIVLPGLRSAALLDQRRAGGGVRPRKLGLARAEIARSVDENLRTRWPLVSKGAIPGYTLGRAETETGDCLGPCALSCRDGDG